MRKPDTMSLWIVDLGGAAALLLCGAVLVWLVGFKHHDVEQRVATLQPFIEQARTDLSTAQALRDRQADRLNEQKQALSETGKLPAMAPVTDYLQFLSAKALDHRLQVRRHSPLAKQTYPGLREHRFAYELSGSLSNLMSFFHDVENTAYWADIGFLTLREDVASPETNDRTAALTISLFELAPLDEPAEGKEAQRG